MESRCSDSEELSQAFNGNPSFRDLIRDKPDLVQRNLVIGVRATQLLESIREGSGDFGAPELSSSAHSMDLKGNDRGIENMIVLS
jgi:hypothetical protein